MSQEDKDLEILKDAQESEQFEGLSAEDVSLSPEEQRALDSEIELQKKYGDQELRTFAESTASGATLGLSDQALVKSGLVDKDDLKNRRNINKASALAGEVTGTVVPGLLSGGSSIIGKVAAKTGAGLAARAGLAVERVTSKALANALKGTAAKEIVKKALTRGAGSAVEGAALSTGQLISENALGQADLNAQNLMAAAGLGAAIGSAPGTVFGTAEALVPIVSKSGKLKDFALKKTNFNKSAQEASEELIGFTPVQRSKLRPEVRENLSNVLADTMRNQKVSKFSKREDLYKGLSSQLDAYGDDIATTISQVDNILDDAEKLTKGQFASRAVQDLDELKVKLNVIDADGNIVKGAKADARKIDKMISEFAEDINDPTILNANALNDLKKIYQSRANYARRGDLPLNEEMNRQLARSYRSSVNDLADRATKYNPELAANLKKANLNYGTAAESLETLGKSVEKMNSKSFIDLQDTMIAMGSLGIDGGLTGSIALAAKKYADSDIRRKLIILSSIEKANKRADTAVNSSIKEFFTKPLKAAKTGSTKILLNNTLIYPEPGEKKPKTKKEAMARITSRLDDMISNPDKMIEKLTKNTLRITKVAPNTADQIDQSIIRAVSFLQSKIPRPAHKQGMLPGLTRKWEPSTIEIAKFERYVEAVESPLNVLEDLKSGTITQEQIEALKVVYPALYAKVQDKALEYIGSNPDLKYQKRLQLGILLDIPSDSSLIPENIDKLQSSFNAQQVSDTEQSQPAVETSQTGLNKLSFDQSAATDTQLSQERRRN